MTMITQDKAKRFYKLTSSMLNSIAENHNVKNIDNYYKLTDFDEKTKLGKCISDLHRDSINSVFAQMAFHAQNATLISNIVNFENNIVF